MPVRPYDDVRLHAAAAHVVGVKVELTALVSKVSEKIGDGELVPILEVHVGDSARSGVGERQDRESEDEAERTPLDGVALVVVIFRDVIGIIFVVVLHLHFDADEHLLLVEGRLNLLLGDIEQDETCIVQELVSGDAFVFGVVHAPEVDFLSEAGQRPTTLPSGPR